MGYKHKKSVCHHKGGKKRSKKIVEEFPSQNFQEKGRLQFFFHSPSSELPVRDVRNEQKKGHKTEPHIEIGAENYIYCCYQSNNIIPFLKSNERYLFLFTTCKNKKLDNYYGKRFVVGYIVRQPYISPIRCDCSELIRCGFIDCENCEEQQHYAVRGEVKIFSFKDAYPLKRLFPTHKNIQNIRIKCLSEIETERLLKHFKDKDNILSNCIEEINRLDKYNRTCQGKNCKYYQKECLRWNQ